MRTESQHAARALIWEVRRAGFTQLRKTSNGYLYGSGTYRFEVPYAVVQGSSSLEYTRELLDRFKIERAKRDAEFGKVVADIAPLEPFANPDDLLHAETEGGSVAGPTLPSAAPEGSIPSALPTSTETAVVAPAEFSGAGTGSTPVGLPTTPPHERSETMSKAKRKPYTPWTCPKCGETFKTPGRHAQSCTGKRSGVEVPVRRRKGGEPAPELTKASLLNGYSERVAAFEKSSADMVSLLRDVLTEVEVYKRDSMELQTMRQQLSVMFQKSAVPR